MGDAIRGFSAAELQAHGWLLVEDGNHGEYRPRPHEFGTGDWAFIRAADLDDDGNVLFGQAQLINDIAKQRIRKGIGLRGDVILSHKGTVGRVAFVHGDAPSFVCSPQTTFWRATDKDKINNRFLYFLLRSPDFQRQLDARKGETDMAPYVSLTAQRQLRLTLPKIEEQRAIACVLSALDDKIALNRRMVRTLEMTAAVLFESWFMDFDPVIAKRQERLSAGVSSAAYQLMPNRLVNHAEGRIPNGWRAGHVGEEFDVRMGQSPPGASYNATGEGTPFFQGCTDFGFRYPTRRLFTTAPSRFADSGDTLVSVRAPVGRVNMAAERCCIGRGLAAVRHRSKSRSFTYYAMRSLEERFAVFEGEGTLFGSITRDGFGHLPIIAPPSEIISAFEAQCGPLDQRVAVNERENALLANLRDTLLPQFLSGAVRVRDAEKLVEAAV